VDMGLSSTVRLLSAVAVMALVAGCAPAVEAQTVVGVVVAGPTCPVVTDPPDPACEDRPVAGARIVVLDADGDEVGTVVSGEDGTFSVELEPGRYELVAQPVEGLLGTAPVMSVIVAEGVDVAPITLVYDTGIR
jgi:hypothetical protein